MFVANCATMSELVAIWFAIAAEVVVVVVVVVVVAVVVVVGGGGGGLAVSEFVGQTSLAGRVGELAAVAAAVVGTGLDLR